MPGYLPAEILTPVLKSGKDGGRTLVLVTVRGKTRREGARIKVYIGKGYKFTRFWAIGTLKSKVDAHVERSNSLARATRNNVVSLTQSVIGRFVAN